MNKFTLLLVLPLASLSVVSCTETATAPSPVVVAAPASSNPYAGSGVSNPNFRLPAGTGCRGAVERFQATIDNDLETGHTTPEVHKRMSGEIAGASNTCNAGQDGAAQAQIRSIRSRFGYPAG